MSVIDKALSVPDPDDDIIPLIASGDQRAFRLLVDRHTQTLLMHATYMLGDSFAAEDVTQAVFLKTWKMLPNWDAGSAKLLTWMRKVSTNLCIDRLRKKRAILSDKPVDDIDAAPLQSDVITGQQTRDIVFRALQRLPENQRAAISLSYYQSLSQREGSDVLGVSEKAYESLLVRARRKLKDILKETKDNLGYLGADHGS